MQSKDVQNQSKMSYCGESVSRKKYDTLKLKAEGWRTRFLDLEERHERLLEDNEQLIQENDRLHKSASNKEMDGRKDLYINNFGNRDSEVSALIVKHKQEILEVERKLMLSDNTVERLRSSLEDAKERIAELREDNRELRLDFKRSVVVPRD